MAVTTTKLSAMAEALRTRIDNSSTICRFPLYSEYTLKLVATGEDVSTRSRKVSGTLAALMNAQRAVRPNEGNQKDKKQQTEWTVFVFDVFNENMTKVGRTAKSLAELLREPTGSDENGMAKYSIQDTEFWYANNCLLADGDWDSAESIIETLKAGVKIDRIIRRVDGSERGKVFSFSKNPIEIPAAE